MANSGRRAHLVLDLLTAGVFGVIAGPLTVLIARGAQRPGSEGAALPWVVVAVVAMTVALGFARRAPVTALIIASGAAVAQLVGGLPPLFADIAVLGVLFAAGADDRRAVRLAGLAAGIVGAVVAAVYLALPGWQSGPGPVWRLVGPLFVAGLLCFVLAWTFGLLVWMTRRSHRERERTLAAQRETAAEQERVRIAREMHDVVAHSLTVIVAQADGARYAGAGAGAALATIGGVARDALADVRLLLAQLRHAQPTLAQPGLAEPGLAELDGLIEQVRAAGLPVTAAVEPPPAALPGPVQLALYRIVQESLTNALRHGDTSRPARLELRWDDGQVRLDLRSYLRAGPADSTTGHGLAGMAERARLVGGTLTAGRSGEEFVVSSRLPCGRRQHDH